VKVLFVTNMWPDERRPWYGTFIKTQADSLERLGVQVNVLPLRGYESRSAYAKGVGELRRLVRANRYDVVHAHYGHAAVVARFQRAAPLVVSYCGDDVLGTPSDSGRLTLRSRVEAAVFRTLAYFAAATITKSEEMERALPAPRRAQNRVIPNGVDVDRFAPIERERARRELGWGDEPVALFVGDPTIARKNFKLADEATARASSAIPGLRLHVAHGFEPAQVPVFMSAADALILTSLWEGSPNVVKEAMAAELPVVAVPAGDVEERLAGVSGCFVRAYDAEALGEALAEAIRHGRSPEARRAVSALSLERVAERVLDVYQGAIGAGMANGRDPIYPRGRQGPLNQQSMDDALSRKSQ
jgi:glycosyltransferase involved in cell wall biosynthesis